MTMPRHQVLQKTLPRHIQTVSSALLLASAVFEVLIVAKEVPIKALIGTQYLR